MSVFDAAVQILLGFAIPAIVLFTITGPNREDASNVTREGPMPLPKREPFALFDAIDSERLDARRLEAA